MDGLDKCGSCRFACPWTGYGDYILCSLKVEQKGPFDPACGYFIDSKSKGEIHGSSRGKIL